MAGWLVAAFVLVGAAVTVAWGARRLDALLPVLAEQRHALETRRAALTEADDALDRTRMRAADLAERTQTSAEAAH